MSEWIYTDEDGFYLPLWLETEALRENEEKELVEKQGAKMDELMEKSKERRDKLVVGICALVQTQERRDALKSVQEATEELKGMNR